MKKYEEQVPYAINPDKLYLTFKSNEVDTQEDIKDFFKLSGYDLKSPLNKINHNYKFSNDICLNNQRIATLRIGSRNNPYYNRLDFYNNCLYQSKKDVVDLFKLTENQFDSYISRLEIAVDSNFDFISLFEFLIQNNSLSWETGFTSDYYGNEVDINGKYVRGQIGETKYIHHKSAKFNEHKSMVTGKYNSLRIENKRDAISGKKSRKYLIPYLQDNGIQVNQDFFRMELCIKDHQGLNISSNIHYYHVNGDSISETTLNKAKKYIKSHNSTDPNYEKYYWMTKNYTKKQNKKKYYHPDIQDLLYNKHYLVSLFDKLVSKIIKNNSDFFDIQSGNCALHDKWFVSNGSKKSKKDPISKIDLAFEILVKNKFFTEAQVKDLKQSKEEKKAPKVDSAITSFDFFGQIIEN